MTTVIGIGTIPTARDLAIFRALTIARILDGGQIQIIGRFSSVRRTNRRLLKLVQAGLLRRWFVGTACGGQRALYGLSPRAATLIGETVQGLIPWKQDQLITSSQFLAHQQAINTVFIAARFQSLPPGLTCERWLRPRVPLSPSVPLIPDGYFEIVQQETVNAMFLEVDLGSEASKVWKRKAELYLRLAVTGECERLFGRKQFRTLVLFPSFRRLDSIRRIIAKRTEKVFFFSTFDEVARAGLWGPIWLRPVGDDKRAPL